MTTRAFVATTETQGLRKNDFCFVPEGELLTFPTMICTGEWADDRCGCNRSLCGVKSHTATTTAQVVDIGNHNALVDAIYTGLITGGWGTYSSKTDLLAEAIETAAYLLAEAEEFSLGTIVEYREGQFNSRPSIEHERSNPSSTP